jgi:hypothetical protein
MYQDVLELIEQLRQLQVPETLKQAEERLANM